MKILLRWRFNKVLNYNMADVKKTCDASDLMAITYDPFEIQIWDLVGL
jgi:hypothetical protein